MREAMLITHFVGLAMGVGSGFAFMFLGIAASKMEPEEAFKFSMKTFVVSRMGYIGLTLLIISGLYLMTPYWKVIDLLPLLIAKLVLVLVLATLIGIISSTVRKAKTGRPEILKRVRPLGMLTLLTSISIIVLAVLVFH